jgi:membrane protease YdiL (CAAX protease family)
MKRGNLMKTINSEYKNSTKIVVLTSILSLIAAYIWNFIVVCIVEAYQVKRLGNREAGKVFMDKLMSTSLPFQIILSLGTEVAILLSAYLIVKKYSNGKFSLDLIGMKANGKSTKKLFLSGAGAALLMTFIIFGGLTAFKHAKFLGSDYANCYAINILISIITAFILGAAAGFAEEIVFRGVIFRFLANKKGKVFALIVSSVIFSIGHANRLDPLYLLYTFLIGIFLGSLYIITGSIYFSIAFHFVWNSFSFLISVNGDNLVNIKSALNFYIGTNTYFGSIIFMFGVLLFSIFMIKRQKRILSI